jgi:serine/threonine protein kinase
MGCVYKAVNVEIGLKVALKHLHLQFAGEESVVRRFRQEAKLAASIGHDNICEVIDFGTAEDGSPFLVMPRLRGMSLADLMKRDVTLPPNVIADIVCQTLSALEAAHGENIVHRDLKPDNIFITKVGDRENFVKLLDFGISKIMDQDSVSGMTKTGTILGTPYYMAPEQARGAKEIDARTDIWAMGVIVYEALCGKKPFDGDSYNEIMFKICDSPFRAPSALVPDIPPFIEEIALRAMIRDPDGRFQSAKEMRQALEKARDRITASIALPSVNTAEAFAPTMVSIPPEQPPTILRRSKRPMVFALAIVALICLAAAIVFINHKRTIASPVAVPLAPVSSSVDSPQNAVEKRDVSQPTQAAPLTAQTGETKPADNSAQLKATKTNGNNPGKTQPGKSPVAEPKNSRPNSTVKGRFNTEVDPDYE